MNRFYSDFQKLSLREKQIATLMSEGCDTCELEQRLRLDQSRLGSLSREMMKKLSKESMNDFQNFLNWVKKHLE